MKKKLINLCIITSLFCGSLFLLSSCKSLMSAQNYALNIKQGMSPQEVVSIMGQPDLRRFNETGEEWVYRKSDLFNSYTYVINFSDDKVTALDSFINPPQNQQENVANIVPPPPPPINEYNYRRDRAHVVGEEEFSHLMRNIKKESFKDDQMKVLQFSINGNRLFTCQQCVRFMSLTVFSDEKKNIFRLVAPYIIDPENYKMIVNDISVFSEDEVRNTLLRNNRNRR